MRIHIHPKFRIFLSLSVIGILSIVSSFAAGLYTPDTLDALVPGSASARTPADTSNMNSKPAIDRESILSLLSVLGQDDAAATQWKITDLDGDHELTLRDALWLLASLTPRQ